MSTTEDGENAPALYDLLQKGARKEATFTDRQRAVEAIVASGEDENIEIVSRRLLKDAIQALVGSEDGKNQAHLFLRAEIEDFRQRLGWNESGGLERMAIQHLLLLHVHLLDAQNDLTQLFQQKQFPIWLRDAKEKRLDRAHKLWTRAAKTLATIRRQKLPDVLALVNVDARG